MNDKTRRAISIMTPVTAFVIAVKRPWNSTGIDNNQHFFSLSAAALVTSHLIKFRPTLLRSFVFRAPHFSLDTPFAALNLRRHGSCNKIYLKNSAFESLVQSDRHKLPQKDLFFLLHSVSSSFLKLWRNFHLVARWKCGWTFHVTSYFELFFNIFWTMRLRINSFQQEREWIALAWPKLSSFPAACHEKNFWYWQHQQTTRNVSLFGMFLPKQFPVSGSGCFRIEIPDDRSLSVVDILSSDKDKKWAEVFRGSSWCRCANWVIRG